MREIFYERLEKRFTDRVAMRIVTLALVGVLSGALVERAVGDEGADSPPEPAVAAQWTQDHLTNPQAQLPFSFIYDGRQSAQLLAAWPKVTADSKLDSDRRQKTFSWTDKKSGLEVRCVAVEFSDFPAVEWTVFFKNTGSSNTPILERIRAIDAQFPATNRRLPHLRYINGDGETNGKLQFAPREKTLGPSAEARFSSLNGRPTDPCFPYYNLDWDGSGVIVVLGWPGQWSASFTSDAKGGVHIDGGQEITHLSLHPGEEIRSPRVVTLFWKGGNWIDAQNIWRRWMRAHNMPKPGGKEAAVIRAGGGFMYDKLPNYGASLLNEKDQNALIDRYREEGIKLNTWWIDIFGAGTWGQYSDQYYPVATPVVLSWDTDLARFPHGLRAVGDHAATQREKLMVWIEPEHVMGLNTLSRDHPGWLLSVPDDPTIKKQINQGAVLGNRRVVNLGNADACQWMIDRLEKLIADEGIQIYRQDFNITPLIFWRQNDAPDRMGMTENFYVQGYLRLFDTLQARFPNLLIDTCASGGRRDDIETLRRALPLWKSDQWGADLVQQTETFGLALWIPYFGTGTNVTDPYAYRSSLGSSLMTSWDLRDTRLDYAKLRKLEAEFWRTAPFFKEDYYPLTTFNSEESGWMAWQFNRLSLKDGLVQAFRRKEANEAAKTVQLRGLDPAAIYRIEDVDAVRSYTASGKDLMEQGINLNIKDKPGALVIIYTQVR